MDCRRWYPRESVLTRPASGDRYIKTQLPTSVRLKTMKWRSTSIANEVVKRALEGGLAIEIWPPITL